MEEKISIEEQPSQEVEVNFASANKENSNNEDNCEGSSLGKFKDAKSLLDAYTELEKEFTKKSQKLSNLIRTIESDNASKDVPLYEREEWHKEFQAFFQENESAWKYKSEIASLLLKDKNLACASDCLDRAYSKVLASKYKSKEELLEDEKFLEESIYRNENIKSKIISLYLEDLKNKNTPPVILNSKGISVDITKSQRPSSLIEAKKMVEKLFK